MIILGIGLLALVGVLLYASYTENAKAKATEADIKALRTTNTKLLQELHNLTNLINDNTEKWRGIAQWCEREEKFKKNLVNEVEILQVRQRSMEKKIISSERTVNLVFGKPIPMQIENIPHTIIKQKRGRGRSALIPENA